MSLKSLIDEDLKSAMLARDQLTSDVLKGLKSAILYEEVAKKLRDTGLSDELIEQIISRESKKRDEAAELFERGGNLESAEKERQEKKVLAKYLPEQISDEDLEKVIDAVILDTQPDGLKDMGKVISGVKDRVGNSADGARVAMLVRAKLSQ
jgi:uncharacterized protein YqeY